MSSLAVAFDQLSLVDPIMARLYQGKQQWGEVPFEDWELELAALHPYVRIYNPDINYTELKASVEEKQVVVEPSVELPAGSNGIKTLMAKNLPRDITVEKLRSVFEVYGPLRDVYIPKNMDKSSPYFGTIKGFAKVMFLKPEDSAKAYQAQLNRLTIGANKIVIEFAKEDR
jgi:RNA recognition motif-containing protein